MTNLSTDWGKCGRVWCAQMRRGDSKPDQVSCILISNTGNALLDVHPWDHCTFHRCWHGTEMWYQEKPRLLGRRLRQKPPGDLDLISIPTLNPRESTWYMPGATATHLPASVWSFSMQTLANCSVLTTQPMVKLIRSNNGIEILRAHDNFKISSRVIVLFLVGHNFPGVWRIGLPRNPTLHLGHRRGDCDSLSKLCAGKSSKRHLYLSFRRDSLRRSSFLSTPTWLQSSGTTTRTPTTEKWPPGRWEEFLLICQQMFETWVTWKAVICIIIY